MIQYPACEVLEKRAAACHKVRVPAVKDITRPPGAKQALFDGLSTGATIGNAAGRLLPVLGGAYIGHELGGMVGMETPGAVAGGILGYPVGSLTGPLGTLTGASVGGLASGASTAVRLGLDVTQPSTQPVAADRSINLKQANHITAPGNPRSAPLWEVAQTNLGHDPNPPARIAPMDASGMAGSRAGGQDTHNTPNLFHGAST